MSSFGIIALTPVSFSGEIDAIATRPEGADAAQTSPHYGRRFAAKLAGEAGLINLELHELTDEDVAQAVTAAVTKLSRKQGGRFGIKYSARTERRSAGHLLQALRATQTALKTKAMQILLWSSSARMFPALWKHWMLPVRTPDRWVQRSWLR